MINVKFVQVLDVLDKQEHLDAQKKYMAHIMYSVINTAKSYETIEQLIQDTYDQLHKHNLYFGDI